MSQETLGALIAPYSAKDYFVTTAATPKTDEMELPVRGNPYDQGSVGNCVAQSIRAYMRVLTGKEYGVDMTYGGGRENGRETSGLIDREALDFWQKNGIAPIADDPNNTDVTAVIDYWYKDKLRLKSVAEYAGGAWYRVETEAEIDAVLDSGKPVLVCFPWYGYRPQYEGKGLMRESGTPSGYHAEIIIGRKLVGQPAHKRYKLLNSHGAQAGDGGFNYITPEHALAMKACFVLTLPKTDDTAAPKEDTTPVAVTRRTLRLKSPYMRGVDVKEAQTRLNTHDVGCLIDGVFGSATEAAVEAFQRSHGLADDGIVGKLTWAALLADPKKSMDWMSVAADMTAWLRMMVGWHYIIGAQGHKLTESYLSARYKGHEGYFTNGRLEWLRGEISRAESMGINLYCADCSGLFFKVNEMMGIIPAKDATAHGLWTGYCVEIGKDDVRPGDILFRESDGRMVHMAVVGTDGLYEAAGTAYGVVFRPWADMYSRRTYNRMTGQFDTLKPWTHCARLKALM